MADTDDLVAAITGKTMAERKAHREALESQTSGTDEPEPTEPIYVLHGVAKRDRNELVCMFFRTQDDLAEFEADLPGRYQTLTLRGVAYDDLDVSA